MLSGLLRSEIAVQCIFIFLHFLLLFQNNCLTLHDKVHDFAYENDDTDSENERAAAGTMAA